MSINLPASDIETQIDMIRSISQHINVIKSKVYEMVEARKKANVIENVKEKAIAYCDVVRPYFDVIRYQVDHLEMLVDDEIWPLAKYRELVSIR
jgi:glutamine synthetase